MEKPRDFAVDFYLAGTVVVKAKDREEAIRKAKSVEVDALIGCVENSGFGKDYAEEI